MEARLNIEAELDIFSGRPNPRWILGDDEVSLLHKLPDQPPVAETPSPPALGYRGFVITNLSPDRSIPPRLRVYAATVIVDDRRQGRAYRQPDGLEQLLLTRARDLGYAKVIERFRSAHGTGAGPTNSSP